MIGLKYVFGWLIDDVTSKSNAPCAAPVDTCIVARAALTAAFVPVKFSTFLSPVKLKP